MLLILRSAMIWPRASLRSFMSQAEEYRCKYIGVMSADSVGLLVQEPNTPDYELYLTDKMMQLGTEGLPGLTFFPLDAKDETGQRYRLRREINHGKSICCCYTWTTMAKEDHTDRSAVCMYSNDHWSDACGSELNPPATLPAWYILDTDGTKQTKPPDLQLQIGVDMPCVNSSHKSTDQVPSYHRCCRSAPGLLCNCCG